MFSNGKRIGYARFHSEPSVYQGQPATKETSATRMRLALQGTPLDFSVDSTTYSVKGKVRQMTFRQESGGRESSCQAEFGERSVRVTLTSDGQVNERTIPLPNGPVLDDPTRLLMGVGGAAGTQPVTCWVLDPTSGAFIKNIVRPRGKAAIAVGPVRTTAFRIDIEDPRMTTTCYLSGKGDLLKTTTPLGIESWPISEAEATKPLSEAPAVDLASSTAIVPVGDLADAPSLTRLRLEIVGVELKNVPSGDNQSAKPTNNGWIVEVKPIAPALGTTIAEARAAKPAYLKRDNYMPATDPAMRSLAASIVGNETKVAGAAEKIRLHVYRAMRPNAGIGVLRDAREIWRTKEGVCRDYAILTATLCRAAGIPTRLATGLVTWDGTFYYHAWCEFWNGSGWQGLDSATDSPRFSAGHVKLSGGDVANAFSFPVLGRAKITVLLAAH